MWRVSSYSRSASEAMTTPAPAEKRTSSPTLWKERMRMLKSAPRPETYPRLPV